MDTYSVRVILPDNRKEVVQPIEAMSFGDAENIAKHLISRQYGVGRSDLHARAYNLSRKTCWRKSS